MEVKWIKIVTNIFDDEKIRYIESLPNGDEMIVIWFKILCLAGKSNQNGLLMMTDKIAYTDQMLASVFSRDIKAIQLSLNVFSNLGMIEMIDNKIYLMNWEKHQNAEKLSIIREQTRARVAKYRQKQISSNYNSVTQALRNDIDIEKDKDKDLKNKDIVSKSKRFVPPTLSQVQEYSNESGYQIDADKFIDYYTSKGWLVGKSKMKDWKASVRNWNRNNKQYVQPKRVEVVTDYSQQPKSLSDQELQDLEKALKELK